MVSKNTIHNFTLWILTEVNNCTDVRLMYFYMLYTLILFNMKRNNNNKKIIMPHHSMKERATKLGQKNRVLLMHRHSN